MTGFFKGPPSEILGRPFQWERPRENQAPVGRVIRVALGAVVGPVNTVQKDLVALVFYQFCLVQPVAQL